MAISDNFLAGSIFFILFKNRLYSWITSSSYLYMSFLLGGIYVLETFLDNSSTFLNLVFWERLKVRPSETMRSVMKILRRVSLEVTNSWEFPINTNNKWTIWKTSWVPLSSYIWCRSEAWDYRWISVIWLSDTFGNNMYGVFDGSRWLIL